jgi:sugar phosphate isomerase/epimerase
MKWSRLLFALGTISLATTVALAAEATPAALGVTYAGWKGEYGDADRRLATFKEIGFRMVSLVPTYGYPGLNKIDLASGPDAAELAKAIEAAARMGLAVVLKPHLDPPIYSPGFDGFRSENDSWRAHCPWRGFFDLDPMSDGYRTGVVFASLAAVKTAIDSLGAAPAAPVRLELGAELMNSMVYAPERWVKLLAAAKKERHRLGLDQAVLLSHNFTHHIEIPDDFVARMNPAGRRALARYIRGLDALALSQYMDLTAAMPVAERGARLPSPDEIAQALVLHERNFRRQILVGALGLRPTEIPPLHIGEYGIGRGGLRHPNLWDGAATAAEEKELGQQIERGHQGLLRYLGLPEGRTVQSAVLWVTGPHYDIFGWGDPKYAIPEAAAAIKAGLR